MVGINKGDIFYCDALDKTRPCMVVSANCMNNYGDYVMVANITSQVKHLNIKMRVVLSTSLKGRTATVCLNELTTVRKEDLGDYIGHVLPNDMTRINNALRYLFKI